MACLPYGGGCLFEKVGCLVQPGPPPPWGVGVGQWWVGGFEGKGYIPGAKGAGKFFPLYFPFVLVSL